MSTATRSSKATKQTWSAARKIDLVLGALLKHRPIRELCREAGISRARYYKWRQQFIDAARVGLAHPEAERRALEERLRELEAENALLQQRARVFRELSVAD